MTRKLVGLLFVVTGLLIMIGAFVIEGTWLVFIFGTVIIGVLMLLFTPLLVMAPFFLILGVGTTIFVQGMQMISDDY